MSENVCRFLPKFNDYNFFNIINLVYETECPKTVTLKTAATFRIHLVSEGEGVLHTEKGSAGVSVGDVVIMPPAKPFCFENAGELKYIYISYLGLRASILAEELKIGAYGSVFHGYERLIPLWSSALSLSPETANLACEGIVLYSCAEIGNETLFSEKTKAPASAAERVKKFIDDNFDDGSLCLESIADELSYNPKYISSVFCKAYGMRIGDYIRTIRIQHACTLIEQGITSVKNVAPLCGYEDPLYFSSVFKKQMGVSPREHIKNAKV